MRVAFLAKLSMQEDGTWLGCPRNPSTLHAPPTLFTYCGRRYGGSQISPIKPLNWFGSRPIGPILWSKWLQKGAGEAWRLRIDKFRAEKNSRNLSSLIVRSGIVRGQQICPWPSLESGELPCLGSLRRILGRLVSASFGRSRTISYIDAFGRTTETLCPLSRHASSQVEAWISQVCVSIL